MYENFFLRGGGGLVCGSGRLTLYLIWERKKSVSSTAELGRVNCHQI